MCVANFLSEQSANYTYKKGKSVSYTNHLLVSVHIVPKIRDCKLLHNIPDNVSDHVALSMTWNLRPKFLMEVPLITLNLGVFLHFQSHSDRTKTM